MFDILGKMTFDNKPLRELLIEAVRYGNDPAVRARLQQVVDNSLDQQKLRELLDERALTDDTMDVQKVSAIREEMERMEAHKLQPHFIEAFFLEAFRSVGRQDTPSRDRTLRDHLCACGGAQPGYADRLWGASVAAIRAGLL